MRVRAVACFALREVEEEDSLKAGAVRRGCHGVDGHYGVKIGYQPLNTRTKGLGKTGRVRRQPKPSRRDKAAQTF